jgi:hypothetical protein
VRRLSVVLVHFPFGVYIDRAIFGTMISLIAMYMMNRGLGVYGPRPSPRPQFEAPPCWLHWLDLWSKVPESVC